MSFLSAKPLWGLALVASLASAGETVLPMPEGRLYVNECGACHTAYAPALLPVANWRRMMGELNRHFGEDASLNPQDTASLSRQIEALAQDATRSQPQIAQRNGGLPPQEQRISATPYFRYLHDEVPSSIWQRAKVGSKSNCIACHPRANEGRYPEREIQIPK